LLSDDSPDVRISAMTTLGLLRIDTLEEKPTLSYIRKNLESNNSSIAITAGWLGVVLGYEEGRLILKKWIEQDLPEPKRLAAAAIAATGVLGSQLALEQLQKEKDLYAKVNLAIGLIGLRKEVSLAAEVLFEAISRTGQPLWMWNEEKGSLFRSLAPSTVGYIEQIPRYPQVVDQLTRLEILSYLSIIKHPKALEAVKGFLRHQDWGVTGAAASTLLEEGGEDALQLVEQLLTDPEEKVRIQAALILAMLGNDPKSTKVLMQSYTKADRDMKIHILEALGHIKDPVIAPFLLEVLKEPFQSIRVVAASALIQYLYQ
jgi:HEAT repeat protein